MYDFSEEINRRGTSSLKWDVGENELPMWVADMDFSAAPCITQAIERRANHGVFGYTVVSDEWYSSIIGWWKARHAFNIEREWLQFVTGVVPAISSIVRRVTNVGDNVVVLSPVYDIFYHSIENFGRHTLECELSYREGKYSLDMSRLEQVLSHPLTTLLILCNPHNPTGTVWSITQLKAIGELCKKYGVTVISDEIHCDITQESYTPFASVSDTCRDISITCVSASKAFNIAGLQSAAVIIPHPMLRNRVVRGLNSDEVAEPNCFAVEATVAAFTQGAQWLRECNDYIAANKLYAKNVLKETPAILTESRATYLLWIDCSSFISSSDDFCAFLRKTTGLYISPGSQYRGNGKKFVRINVACPRSRLEDGLNRFLLGIKTYKK